ncbi:phage protein [Proteus vulgaris]|nr:phage protein [Proteus vulgaris]
MIDAIKLPLRFVEWRTVEPEYGELPPRSTQKPTQSSTVNRGNVQTKDADTETKKKGSFATRIADGDWSF